jgi:PKD repeat protein
MRKLYTLVAGMFIILAAPKTNGQFNPRDLSQDFSNNFATTVSIADVPSANNDLPEATCRANFEVSPAASSPLTKKFTAIPWHSENKRPVLICWKFGDGTDTCIQYSNTNPGPYSVIHHYQHPGVYEVCVKIVYQGGCEARKCKEVIVGEFCRADFEKLPLTSAVSPLIVSFKALPWHSENKKPKKICWTFGDGKDTCIEYGPNYTGNYVVRHKYREPGLYEVCVKIFYYGGCEANKCKRVQVGRRDECKADFIKLPLSTVNNPLAAIFKALPWHSNNKKPKTIHWNFGDGKDTIIHYTENYTGLYAVRHEYREPGSYQVCVKITYFGGCEAHKCKYIQIGEPDRCGADFQRIPAIASDNPLVVGFKAIPSHNNHKVPKIICWSFGDGKDTCIEYAQNFAGPYIVRHKYDRPGTYNVCVKITYYGGCQAYKCKPIVVTRPDECRADFERVLISTTNNPLTVTYKALPWHNNHKKPKQICWKFGDGKDTCITYPENYTGQYSVRHTYREPGRYEVCVKILYYGGCEARKCKEINVGEFCRADFEKLLVNTTANPLHAAFKALPWHSQDKKPKQICWKFGDGTDTCITYTENYSGVYGVRHEYERPGIYEVCIKILYYGGCEARKCKEIKVGEVPQCKADFERLPVSTTNNPLHVAFKALPWHANDKKPKEICWKFGDGRDTCIQYGEDYAGVYGVRHEYDHSGNYEVCIKILYYGGCEAKKCKEIKVGEIPQCKADFERLPISTTNNPLHVSFKALSWHANDKKPKEICWKFGDGRDTCIQYGEDYNGPYIVHHRYEHPGNYEVCVKITYYGGCEAGKCKLVKVDAPGDCRVKLFQLTPSITSLTRGFFASPWSSENKRPVRVCWYFGDGTDTCIQLNSGLLIPQLFIRHTYPAPGEYRACVKILFDGGCIASDCDEVVIRPTTNVCGGFMTDSLISPRTFKFKGFAIHNPDDPVAGYRWTFGDGSAASGKEVTHQYNAPGTYEVCLTIKTQRGCVTRICKPLHVPGNAQVALQISPNPVLNTMHVLFYSTHNEPVVLKIVNSSGVVVRSWTRNATQGANNWDFDVSALGAGAYTLYVQSPNQLSSQLFIKAN